jgi:hypothetical protein
MGVILIEVNSQFFKSSKKAEATEMNKILYIFSLIELFTMDDKPSLVQLELPYPTE